jgi:hypothetical protein
MKFDHDREWSAAARPEEARQEGFVAVPEIFHVFDVNGIRCGSAKSHTSLLSLMGHRICVSAGYTAVALLVKIHRSWGSGTCTSRKRASPY